MKKIMFSVLIALSLNVYSQQVKESDVPAAIVSAAKSKLSGLPVNSWVKDPERGYYVATVITESVFKQVEIGFDGKWQNTAQVFMADQVPVPVMATIRKNYLSKGYEGSNYTYEEDYKVGRYYTVDVSNEVENLYVTIDPKGTVLKVEQK